MTDTPDDRSILGSTGEVIRRLADQTETTPLSLSRLWDHLDRVAPDAPPRELFLTQDALDQMREALGHAPSHRTLHDIDPVMSRLSGVPLYVVPDPPRLPEPLATPPPPQCDRPPEGWYCTRPPGHDGPCAAWPYDHEGDDPLGYDARGSTAPPDEDAP